MRRTERALYLSYMKALKTKPGSLLSDFRRLDALLDPAEFRLAMSRYVDSRIWSVCIFMRSRQIETPFVLHVVADAAPGQIKAVAGEYAAGRGGVNQTTSRDPEAWRAADAVSEHVPDAAGHRSDKRVVLLEDAAASDCLALSEAAACSAEMVMLHLEAGVSGRSCIELVGGARDLPVGWLPEMSGSLEGLEMEAAVQSWDARESSALP